MMHRAKLDWYEYCENFVSGCKRKCPNCYAYRNASNLSGDIPRNLALGKHQKLGDLYIIEEPYFTERGREDRYPFGFAPTLHRYRYKNLDTHMIGSPIFISALGDMFEDWMPEQYIYEIFGECIARPRHVYMFMTKTPVRYAKLDLPDRDNFWYGTTVSCDAEIRNLLSLPKDRNTFVSIDPLRERLVIPPEYMDRVDWVIIGAEKGWSKSKVMPSESWVKEISDLCKSKGIPVFMRPSLLPVMNDEQMQREKPGPLDYSGKDRIREAYEGECIQCGATDDIRNLVTIKATTGRKGPERNICFLCRPCYENWCTDWKMESHVEAIFGKGGQQNEEELQKDR